MTLFSLLFGLILGSLVGLAVSALFMKLQGATGTRVWIPGGMALRMFLPGITVGMVAAMNLLPPAPPHIGSLTAEPSEVPQGGTTRLVARHVRRSADDLVWEGLDGSLRVVFYRDKNGNGLPDTDEALGSSDVSSENEKVSAFDLDTGELRPGNYIFLARAAVGGREGNVMSVRITIRNGDYLSGE
jgi:hypothetical protein